MVPPLTTLVSSRTGEVSLFTSCEGCASGGKGVSTSYGSASTSSLPGTTIVGIPCVSTGDSSGVAFGDGVYSSILKRG